MAAPKDKTATANEEIRQGQEHLQRGNPRLASEHFSRAVKHFPQAFQIHAMLGDALAQMRQYDKAALSFRRAADLAPTQPTLRMAEGEALAAAGKWGEACTALHKALAIRDTAAIRLALAGVLARTNQMREAASHLVAAAKMEPKNSEPLSRMGWIALNIGDVASAAQWFDGALALSPARLDCLVGMALIENASRRPAEAEEYWRRALAINPKGPELWMQLGNSLWAQSKIAEAQQAYAQEWHNSGNPLMPLRQAACIPLVCADVAEIHMRRRLFAEAIQAEETQRITVSDPVQQGLIPNNILSYHNLDDLDIQTALAGLYRKICPALSYTAPHVGRGIARPGGRLRVGFASIFLRSHTIGRLFGETLAHMPAERIERVLFYLPAKDDAYQQSLIAGADKAVALTGNLTRDRDLIAAECLDVLVYPDIGMEPLTFRLAFARLAPLQCVSWGHPDTTGIDTIDVFLSCEAMEPEDGDGHYSERLVRLPGTGVFYRRPTLPAAEQVDRAALGLPENRTIYGCPQNVFKLHPDFDAVLAEILKRDDQGVLALLSDPAPAANAALLERLVGNGVPRDRIHFVPRQSRPGYMSLLKTIDVMLDALHYSGGNTSLEALSLGTPIVTLPGRFMRTRHTYGFYREMGVNETVATSPEDYVAIAVRLGTDRQWRNHVSGRILAACPVLFEDQRIGPAWADTLEQLATGQHSPSPRR